VKPREHCKKCRSADPRACLVRRVEDFGRMTRTKTDEPPPGDVCECACHAAKDAP
jgi:hypothetical protein